MKRLISIILVALTSMVMYAQKDVIKFLGIPVDGTKEAVRQKLVEKGFKYNEQQDFLEGKYNGSDVYISIITDNDKVWRIVVHDAVEYSEAEAKIRFNRMCKQFESDENYTTMSIGGNSFAIPDDEDISHEMSVNGKKYEGVFSQNGGESDSIYVRSLIMSTIVKNFTIEQIQNPTEEVQAAMSREILKATLEYYMKKAVWFHITSSSNDKFRITIHYDNDYFNHPDRREW